MKTTKQNEALEIGSLIQELVEKGYSRIQIDKDETGFAVDNARWSVNAYCDANNLSAWEEGLGIVETLSKVIDIIRSRKGEPSLEEELAQLLRDDNAFEGLPGVSHCVRCGSEQSLIVEIPKQSFALPWGETLDPTKPLATIYPAACKLARCPECGQHYRLSF